MQPRAGTASTRQPAGVLLAVVTALLALGDAAHSSASLAHAPCCAPSCAPGLQERLSLEQWLRDLRDRRDGARTHLTRAAEDLAASFAALEVLPPRSSSDPITDGANAAVLSDLQGRIASLGGPGAGLVVDWIDPGPQPEARAEVRAEVTVRGLSELSVASIEPRLAEILQSGSQIGRANAARLLCLSERPQHASRLLIAAFRESQGALRTSILEAVFSVPGDTPLALAEEVLASGDRSLQRTALSALAAGRRADFAPRIDRLLLDGETARALLAQLLEFYRACPEACGDEQLIALIGLATDARTEEHLRFEIVAALPEFTDKLDSTLRAALETLRDHRKQDMREATLITLHRLGDRKARREILAPYDEAIEKSPEWALRYVVKADALYRMADWAEAIKTYRKALQVGRNDPSPPKGAHLGMARSYAQQGKLKDAAQWLEQAPISIRELRELAQEPVFAELRESQRYGAVFRLDE